MIAFGCDKAGEPLRIVMRFPVNVTYEGGVRAALADVAQRRVDGDRDLEPAVIDDPHSLSGGGQERCARCAHYDRCWIATSHELLLPCDVLETSLLRFLSATTAAVAPTRLSLGGPASSTELPASFVDAMREHMIFRHAPSPSPRLPTGSTPIMVRTTISLTAIAARHPVCGESSGGLHGTNRSYGDTLPSSDTWSTAGARRVSVERLHQSNEILESLSFEDLRP